MDDNIRFTEEEMDLLLQGLPDKNTQDYKFMQELLEDYNLYGLALRLEEIRYKKVKIKRLQDEIEQLIEELPSVLKDKI